MFKYLCVMAMVVLSNLAEAQQLDSVGLTFGTRDIGYRPAVVTYAGPIVRETIGFKFGSACTAGLASHQGVGDVRDGIKHENDVDAECQYKFGETKIRFGAGYQDFPPTFRSAGGDLVRLTFSVAQNLSPTSSAYLSVEPVIQRGGKPGTWSSAGFWDELEISGVTIRIHLRALHDSGAAGNVGGWNLLLQPQVSIPVGDKSELVLGYLRFHRFGNRPGPENPEAVLVRFVRHF